MVNKQLGIRASYVKTATRLATDLLGHDVSTIVFGLSRPELLPEVSRRTYGFALFQSPKSSVRSARTASGSKSPTIAISPLGGASA